MSIPHSTHFVVEQSADNPCQSPLQKSPEAALFKTDTTPPPISDSTDEGEAPPHDPLDYTKRHTAKGSHAKFLYENPRFINEPIMHVLPQECSQSVSECMDWSAVEQEGAQSTISRVSGGTG